MTTKWKTEAHVNDEKIQYKKLKIDPLKKKIN